MSSIAEILPPARRQIAGSARVEVQAKLVSVSGASPFLVPVLSRVNFGLLFLVFFFDLDIRHAYDIPRAARQVSKTAPLGRFTSQQPTQAATNQQYIYISEICASMLLPNHLLKHPHVSFAPSRMNPNSESFKMPPEPETGEAGSTTGEEPTSAGCKQDGDCSLELCVSYVHT